MLCVLAANAQPAPPAGPPDSQDLIFFTADGPVRVRLAVTTNGKPVSGSWTRGLDALFAHYDRDGDGTLSAKERERITVTQQQQLNLGFRTTVRATSVSFAERDGKVDRDAFRAGFMAAGLGPVSVTPVAARKDSAALTAALFKRLDADGDGKLSAGELKAARTRLAAADTNEDELITSDEVLNRLRNPYYGDFDVEDLISDSRRRPTPPPLPDVFLSPAGQPVTAKAVLADRDKDKDSALSAAELGCAALPADLDADGDGRLDTDELAAWLRRPADLDLAFDLPDPISAGSWLANLLPGRRPAPVAVGKSTVKGRLGDRAKPQADGSVAANLPDARMRFTADATTGVVARQSHEQNVANVRAGFALLSAGKDAVRRKQVAEKEEYAGSLPLFDFADRDADGAVTAAELDRSIRTGTALINCRATVQIADLGRGLFELIDRNSDGRLSPRELNAAADFLTALDRDGDGALAPAEIPRGYTLTARAASIEPVPQTYAYGGVVFAPVGVSASPAGPPAAVPEWFQSGDRNGDGDVSAREFAGPPALFKRIDADGDGLIDADEARAFAAKSKK